MKYSAEELSRAGDKYIGRSYDEMDCQAFVEKCMADVGYDRNLAGSNAWYRAMQWTGSPEECVQVFGCVPAGALLFILEQNGKEPNRYRGDGIGNASHIGIKTGRGDGAIHSSHSKGGVVTSVFKDKTIKNGGWNRVGLLKVFDYGKAVNWVLEHGGQAENVPEDPGEEAGPLQGVVVAENGGTVKLRQRPSSDCGLWWNVDVGDKVIILEQGTRWTKCIAGGLTGWMKNEYIRVPEGDETGEDDPVVDPGPGGGSVVITLGAAEAAAALPVLNGILRQIIDQVGRG